MDRKSNFDRRALSSLPLAAHHWPLFFGRLPVATCHLSLFFLLLAVPAAHADDISLKDGRKISGTIVGFENGMFRVETEYGFILVRKDKVTLVKVTEGGAKDETGKLADRKASSEKAEAAVNGRSNPAASPRPDRVSSERAPSSPGELESASLPPRAAAPPRPVVSRPLEEPPPAHMKEHVDGNTYVNDTFHFAMYKPPEWKIYDELPRGKVSALVAIASEDEQTLLFVDRQAWSGTPDLKNDGVEANLRRIYQNYKMISETETQIDGRTAIRRDFNGVMDGAEWHGVVVRVAQGSAVFGIIGMTSAETFQFKEAVLNKILKSFHFLNATAEVISEPRLSYARFVALTIVYPDETENPTGR